MTRLRGRRKQLRIAWCLLLAFCLSFSTSCRFPGTVRPTVKIGLVAPFEGRYRYVGYDVIYAVRLAVREANASGDASGFGVELVSYDDRADPSLAVSQARKMDVDPQVVGAIGHFRESTTKAALGTYADAQVPLLVPTALDKDIRQAESAYTLGPSAHRLAQALLDQAEAVAGDRAVAVLGDGGPLSEALRQQARRQGMPLAVFSADSDGWQAAVLAQNPGVLLCDLDPVRAGEVVAALRERGWGGHVLGGPPLSASDFPSVAGDAAAGATFVTPWPFPRDVRGGEAFLEAYREVSSGTEPGPLALPAYEAAWMLLEAVQKAGSAGLPSRDAVAAALFDVERDGLLGHLTLGADDASSDLRLFWYRIGTDGAPTSIEVESSSAQGSLSERFER
ncbi:MAG: branched-chain amino acid ABC transporter substrate-binding protein [Anaerolineae bacterium]